MAVETEQIPIGIRSVNIGVPSVLVETDRGPVWSGIAKSPVAPGTALWLSLVNLSGDGQADLTVHGGVDKGVYAYPSEPLDPWATELDQPIGPASFGENLTTVGVTETDVCIGDIWSWGQ